jgi:hypothetical protein
VKRLVLAVLVLLVSACGEGPEPERPSRAAADWSSLPGGWSALPSPPFTRARAVSVWTGHELFYWGGESNFGDEQHADGAVYDPGSKSWRRLPAAPIGARASAGAAWTGTEVVVWGGWGTGPKGDGAAYEPASDAWRPLPQAPIEARVPVAAVWTGSELIVWGDVSRQAEDVDGAAYDPASDRWRRLPPAPFALNGANAVWTGKEMIVYGALLDGNNWSSTKHARGIAYDPATDAWREIAAGALSPQASTVVWTGAEMLAWDYELQAAAYDPSSDTWREVPDLPLDFSECYPQSALGDGVVLAWHCGRAAVLDLARETWRVTATPRDDIFARPVSAGQVFLFAGASHESEANGAWAYRPDGDTAFVPPTEERPEGIAMPLTFPDGTRIVLGYPFELELAGLGVQPDVSYLYQDDRAARFPLTFVHGPATAGPSQVALPAGSWTILAPLRGPGDKEVVERSLRTSETPDGFPVVEALAPLELSHDFGEGGGVQLALGDLAPDPEVVSSLEPLILLAPGGCGLAESEVGDGYGARCFGDVYVGVYGERAFIEAVLSGLRLEEP